MTTRSLIELILIVAVPSFLVMAGLLWWIYRSQQQPEDRWPRRKKNRRRRSTR